MANIVDGVLKGNLFMKGSGDPFLTLERFWYHLFSLRQNGITHIEGDFVIDNTAFELKPHDPDAFDGKATRLYNVGPSASLVNFSATNFVIQPKGNKVRVHANPPLANLVIENKLKLVSGKCGNKQSGWSFETRRKEGKIIARFNGKISFQMRRILPWSQHYLKRDLCIRIVQIPLEVLRRWF